MKKYLSGRTPFTFVFVMLALAASLSFWACSNGLLGDSDNLATNTESFPVTVSWGGDTAARTIAFDNGAVNAVMVIVYSSATGERIGSGPLARRTSDWGGTITVSENVSAVFEASAVNSDVSVLYVGRITQTLTGTNDLVTIPVGAAGLKSGSIQGYAPTLSTYVNTFAGSAVAGTGVTSPLVGAAALFTNPYGMVSDGTNLYVVDMGSSNIRKVVIATQSVSTYAGQINGAATRTEAVGTGAAFSTPRGIATDGTNFYIADYGNNTIRKIVIGTATVSAFAGTGGAVAGFVDGLGAAAFFNSPSGITYHNGYLYVADTANNRIRKIDVSNANVTTLAGAPDVDGPVNAGSTDGTALNAKFNVPQGITTDGTYVYVADTGNNKIRRIAIADGVTLTIAGTGVAGVGNGVGNVATFNLPTGIATDGTNLFITDFASHLIRKITGASTAATSADTVVTTLAGTASTAGTISGTGTAAQFDGPSGIATDGVNLYVSDYSGHTIRKIQ